MGKHDSWAYWLQSSLNKRREEKQENVLDAKLKSLIPDATNKQTHFIKMNV